MKKSWIVVLAALAVSACASAGDQANEAAADVGEAAGEIGRIPSSVGEGFGEGMRPQEDDGPYDRSQQR